MDGTVNTSPRQHVTATNAVGILKKAHDEPQDRVAARSATSTRMVRTTLATRSTDISPSANTRMGSVGNGNDGAGYGVPVVGVAVVPLCAGVVATAALVTAALVGGPLVDTAVVIGAVVCHAVVSRCVVAGSDVAGIVVGNGVVTGAVVFLCHGGHGGHFVSLLALLVVVATTDCTAVGESRLNPQSAARERDHCVEIENSPPFQRKKAGKLSFECCS